MIFTRSLGLGFLLIVITPLLFALTRHFQKRDASRLKNEPRGDCAGQSSRSGNTELPADDPLAE